MMTRKDFVIIADNMKHIKPRVIRGEYFSKEERDSTLIFNQWEQDVKQLAHALKLINPNFDNDKFIKACEGTNEDV